MLLMKGSLRIKRSEKLGRTFVEGIALFQLTRWRKGLSVKPSLKTMLQ